ncbi:hypothetical protein OIU34_17135 [Pararhizobium sp. BT-229]|uniref:hypothetical protein n=1 Tax=Pararhizobium sp. BT-229 TaxID=2986923 RepID=UPI0021F7E10B|nr:hypothetical protein [Pararhizobium sp. BT-229]MCV9963626.1 hypothetical protein [Pararhizobium sp. BT-229]
MHKSFEEVAVDAQERFDRFMAKGDFNPFSVAHSSIRDALADLTDENYAKLIGERPHLLGVMFVTKEVPVQQFTVRRVLGDAMVPEFEKMITYEDIDRAVLETYAGREPPAHMAANFRAAIASRLGAAVAGI